MKLIIPVALILVWYCSGCAGRPYGEVGLTYKLSSSDYWIKGSRSWQCIDPGIDVEAGWEFNRHVRVGAYHRSMVLCGGPWNSEPEITEDGLAIRGRIGGVK